MSCRSLLPPSKAELLVTGLNLLRLLVQNRIAEFHTELELLPQQVLFWPLHPTLLIFEHPQSLSFRCDIRLLSASDLAQAQKEPYVREVIQIEQWLMEGAYNKVLAARQDLPAPQFAHFIDLLATTVRCVSGILPWTDHAADVNRWSSAWSPRRSRLVLCRAEVAGCSEEAYASLKLAHARELLMFEDDQLTLDYTAQVRLSAVCCIIPVQLGLDGKLHNAKRRLASTMQRGWERRDDRIFFQPHADKPARDIKSVEVIGNSLTYARELERIV